MYFRIRKLYIGHSPRFTCGLLVIQKYPTLGLLSDFCLFFTVLIDFKMFICYSLITEICNLEHCLNWKIHLISCLKMSFNAIVFSPQCKCIFHKHRVLLIERAHSRKPENQCERKPQTERERGKERKCSQFLRSSLQSPDTCIFGRQGCCSN